VAGEYVDNDISVSQYSREKTRPAYDDLLDRVRTGEPDRVVAWHVDRLYRRPRDLEDLIDLADEQGHQVEFHTLHGDIDLSTGDGRAMARVLVAFAAKESDDESRRIRRRIEQDVAEGRPHGPRPFGYLDDKVTPCPDEAPILREMAARLPARLARWEVKQRMDSPCNDPETRCLFRR